MDPFRIAFTLSMLLFPAAFTVFYRPRPDSNAALVRRRRRNLFIATAGAVVLYGLLLLARRAGWLAFWAELPRWMTWGASPDEIAWILCFPLWSVFAMRLFLALRPEAASPYPAASGQRAASLAPRPTAGLIRRRWWLVVWGIWIAAVIAIVLRGTAEEMTRLRWTMTALFLCGAAIPLLLAGFVLPMAGQEPEPLDPHGSEELRSAYERLRATKVRGLFGMLATMSLLFTALAAGYVFLPDASAALGAVGGIGGALVGIAGAVFGVLMSHRRMEIKRLLDRLSAEQLHSSRSGAGCSSG